MEQIWFASSGGRGGMPGNTKIGTTLYQHWKLWRRAIQMPNGQQSWAKDVGGPSCPRKEAELPPAGNRHSGFMQTEETNQRRQCWVSAALSGLATSAPAWNSSKWKVRALQKIHSSRSGAGNRDGETARHLKVKELENQQLLTSNTMWPVNKLRLEGKQTGPCCKKETDFRLLWTLI